MSASKEEKDLRLQFPIALAVFQDEVTLEPESLKPVGALKTMSPYNAMSLDSRAVTFLSFLFAPKNLGAK